MSDKTSGVMNQELNNDYELDYFELKYLEEISSLFGELKEIDNYYGSDLFKKDYYDYFEFIQNQVSIHEFCDDDVLSDDDIDS
jgi:hypothetical protein